MQIVCRNCQSRHQAPVADTGSFYTCSACGQEQMVVPPEGQPDVKEIKCTFPCKSCGTTLETSSIHIGHGVRCWNCNQKMSMPEPLPPPKISNSPPPKFSPIPPLPPLPHPRVRVLLLLILLLVTAAGGIWWIRSEKPGAVTFAEPLPAGLSQQPVPQISIPWVSRMPQLPAPLILRDWKEVSRKYYQMILDPQVILDGKKFLVFLGENQKRQPYFPVTVPYVQTLSGEPGWRAEIYNNRDLKGAVIKERVDPEIYFDWKEGSPDPVVNRDRFSIRWTGILTPLTSREVAFQVEADDGVRILLDDEVLLDSRGSFKGVRRMQLEKGRRYTVTVEYVEVNGVARIKLNWDHASPEQIFEPQKPEKVKFRIPSYMASRPGGEIFTCVSPVVGARMVGLNPNKISGVDLLTASQDWYDPDNGVYRHDPGRTSPEYHSGIYGYWGALYGIMLADLYPERDDFALQARTATDAFLKIAKGHGCPDDPDFKTLGFNFETGKPGGRNEPMNRLGNAPIVAWMLLVGHHIQSDPEMLRCARSVMSWFLKNPGRYEGTHMMGPLTAARLNAEYGDDFDMDKILAIWFGDGDRKSHGWGITAGTKSGGITHDGIDGARHDSEGKNFRGFSMGSLCGPSWLVPVARYDQRYAKSIARYALHAANSARLFQGYEVDWDHQDHKDWKDRWDPEYLLFYEVVASWDPTPERKNRPYTTGDPIKSGWGTAKVRPAAYLNQKREWFSNAPDNLSLYMGNHVGWLGAIMRKLSPDGVLAWDCVKTDSFHPAAFPTTLVYNPQLSSRSVVWTETQQATDIYDAVTHRFIQREVKGEVELDLAGDQVMVLVEIPSGASLTLTDGRLRANGIVIDFRPGASTDKGAP